MHTLTDFEETIQKSPVIRHKYCETKNFKCMLVRHKHDRAVANLNQSIVDISEYLSRTYLTV